MDGLLAASQRRRSSSVVVVVCFVTVVADFTRHHPAAASHTELTKPAGDELDNDENELITAAAGIVSYL